MWSEFKLIHYRSDTWHPLTIQYQGGEASVTWNRKLAGGEMRRQRPKSEVQPGGAGCTVERKICEFPVGTGNRPTTRLCGAAAADGRVEAGGYAYANTDRL
jgi:hypothetical protein